MKHSRMLLHAFSIHILRSFKPQFPFYFARLAKSPAVWIKTQRYFEIEAWNVIFQQHIFLHVWLVQKLLWNVKRFISFTSSSHFLLLHKFSWGFIITIFPCMTTLSACPETSWKFQKYHFILVSLHISCETASCQSYIWNSSDNCSSPRKCKIREMYLQLCMFLSFEFFSW